MNEYIAASILFILLFVGFGLTHRPGKGSGGCAGCTGTGCSDKTECTKEDKPHHQ